MDVCVCVFFKSKYSLKILFPLKCILQAYKFRALGSNNWWMRGEDFLSKTLLQKWQSERFCNLMKRKTQALFIYLFFLLRQLPESSISSSLVPQKVYLSFRCLLTEGICFASQGGNRLPFQDFHEAAVQTTESTRDHKLNWPPADAPGTPSESVFKYRGRDFVKSSDFWSMLMNGNLFFIMVGNKKK